MTGQRSSIDYARTQPHEVRVLDTCGVLVGVELGLLGDLEVVCPDGPVVLGAAKERQLLAVLAVHRGNAVSQDRLVEALWPHQVPRSAVNAVQNFVLRVRRALRQTELQIVTGPGGYRLEAPDDAIDAAVAERLVAGGRSAVEAGDVARACELLRTAVGMWRGPALEEFAQLPFAEAEARRLDELYEAAREDLVDAELACGDHRKVIGELQGMVVRSPLRERRWAQLMLALYRDGRHADALEAYRTFRQTLARDLGIAPSPAIVALNNQLFRHDPALALQGGPASLGARLAARPRTFVGRAAELQTLADRFEAAVLGHGGVAMVCGEPGIGKTSLLREFAATAGGRGAVVLNGRCVEGDWQPAYHAVAEAIAGYLTSLDVGTLRSVVGPFAGPLVRLIPQLLDLGVGVSAEPRLQPGEDRMRLLDGITRFVARLSVQHPVLLVLDDLHWADASTLIMVRHIARLAPGHRLVLLGAYRTDEAGPQLGAALGAMRSDVDLTSVRLHGLERSSIGELLGAVAAVPVSASLVASIESETRGNPFFVREIIRHLVDEGAVHLDTAGRLATDSVPGVVPEGVRQVLTRRRGRLSAQANLLLEHAAAFDGPFPFAVVATVAGLDEAGALTALDAVLDAGLVEPAIAADRYQFGHALIRHAVLGDMNPSRRVRVHRGLAEELAAVRAATGDISPAEVASQYHASVALPGSEAGVGPAWEAADQAEAAAAHDETAAFLAMALELAPAGDERLPVIMMRLALTQAWAGRFDAAVASALEAADRLAATGGPGPAADHLAAVASALASADGAVHAWQLAGRGLRFAGDRRDQVWASLMVHDLDRREAADPAYPGMTLDVPERREALKILLADTGVAGRPDLARLAVSATYGSRADVPDDVAGDPSVRLFVLGDYPGALPLFEAEAAAARDRGRLTLQCYHRTLAARTQAALGLLHEGRVGLAEAHGIVGRAGDAGWGWQRIHAIGTLDALAHATDVGWTEVLSQLDEAFGAGNLAGRRLEASASACGAKAAARLGRQSEATRLFTTVLPALRQAPAWAMNYLRTLSDAVEALWLMTGPGRHGHPELAMLETAARDKALAADFRFPMVDVRLTLARLCAMDGRYAEAAQWFAESRSVLETQQAWPLRAIVDLDAARVAWRAGEHAAGDELLVRAVTEFERLGMTGWVHRADRAASARHRRATARE